jgi:sulfate permease, SulP family
MATVPPRENSAADSSRTGTLKSVMPIFQWLPSYKKSWLKYDMAAGLALAAYSIPEALVNASLAGLAPQHGLYAFLLAGFIYSLFTTSRHAAVAATSTVSIMIGLALGAMGIEDATRYAEMAAATAMLVGIIGLVAWLLRLSDIVSFISETILSGFKFGAALVIASTQLPKIMGIKEGGHHFFDRIYHVFQNLGDTNLVVLAVGLGALGLMLAGHRILGREIVPLIVVALSITLMSLTKLPEYGVKIIGTVPAGLPVFTLPSLRLSDIGDLVPVAFGCFLLAYVEGISMIRTFAAKHHYGVNPRQELLAAGAANLAVGLGQGLPVAVGLSQSAVNEHAGARTPVSMLVACSVCGFVLLFLAGLFHYLPQSVLAAMVLVAAKGLVNFHELNHLRRVSKSEFAVALVTVLAVLVFGILQGVLVASLVSLSVLVHRVAHPTVTILGRIPGIDQFGGIERHPENQTVPGLLACRTEGDLLYFNVENIFSDLLRHIRAQDPRVQLVVFDLSTSNHVDLEGAKMLRNLHEELSSTGIHLKLVGAQGSVRDLLRQEGLETLVGRIDRRLSLDTIVDEKESEGDDPQILGY